MICINQNSQRENKKYKNEATIQAKTRKKQDSNFRIFDKNKKSKKTGEIRLMIFKKINKPMLCKCNLSYSQLFSTNVLTKFCKQNAF